METGVDDLRSLRRAMRDLVALTTLPAVWAGSEPQDIAESLSDVLLTILRLDLVYLCLKGSPDGLPVELVRTEQQLILGEQAQEIGRVLAPVLAAYAITPTLTIDDPLRSGTLHIAVMPIGHKGTGGHLLAGTRSTNTFTELDRLLLSVAANQAVTALQQAHLLHDLRAANQQKDALLITEQAARAEAEVAQRRLRILAEAGAAFASSLDYEATLARVGNLVVPTIADWCATLIIQDNGDIRVLSAAAENARTLDLLAQIQARTPFDLNNTSGTARVLRTGESVLIPEIEPSLLERYAQNAEHLDLLRQLNSKSAIVVALQARGQILGAISLNMSESGRHYTEDDLALAEELAQRAATAIDRARLYEAERLARQQAEEANATKLTFLAMISHELRTPLTSIKGFATTLLAQDMTFEPETQRDFLTIIDEETDKLTELIEQLLDLSRIQAGTMRITADVTSLTEIIQIARPQLQWLAKEHTLLLDAAHTLPLVFADARRIVQVLCNLVQNATKYSAPHTVITISILPRDKVVQIDVRDEGMGIPVEERPRLFEAFRQVDRKAGSQKGAGLGLAICKGLVEAHGGSIWIQDQESPGTTMSFTLPIAVENA